MENLKSFFFGILTKLLIFIGIVMSTTQANALDCIRIGNLQFSTSGAFASVVSGHNYNDAYVSSFDYMYYSQPSYDIPPTFVYDGNTYTVDKIGLEAFRDGYVDNRNSSKIKHIYIPETVKKIGAGAFYGTSIRSMVIPASVQTFYSPGYNENWHSPFSKSDSYGYQYYNEDLDSLIYLGNTPPSYWTATTNTYVPNTINYKQPNSWAHSGRLIPIVTWSEDKFEYNGMPPILPKFTCNVSGATISLNGESIVLEKDAGTHTSFILAIFSKDGKTYNFEIGYTYTISKAKLNIKASPATREYGEPNPEFELNFSGLIGNDTPESFSPAIIGFSNATSTSNVGDYDILLNVETTKNYEIIFESAKLTVTKAPLEIIVNNSAREYGQTNPNFSAQYYGLKNNESSPLCSNGVTFHTDAKDISPVGDYEVKFVGLPINYRLSRNVEGTLSITKAPIFLVAENTEREYLEDNPEFSFYLDGLRNNDGINCLSKNPKFDCVASFNSDCGEYSVTPSSAEAQNYSITYKPGILTITKAPLTLLADDASREYGEENPILRFSSDGLKGSDTQESALQQLPSLNTSALANSNVGEYPITIIGGASKNYQLSYRQGILTVTKAPLSVSVENAERVYGSDNPSFVRTYLGFKLSDTETSAFSVLPKITCSATKTSDVGEYPIIVSGGTTRNYEIAAYENGILTVTKAQATISANNKSRLYFEENPQFDFSVTGLLNGDTKSCLTTLPSYNCDANILSNVGNYQIVPSDAVAKNYVFEYAPGNLTINKRQLTASVGNYSRAFGEDNPNFEINYNGFVNDENQSVLTESATVSCSATSLSDVGSYPIEIVGGDATNYRISKYNSGTLTITKANQSIIWNQDLSNIELYSQVELTATSDANLPITYEMSPNNVATLYSNTGKWYLDCYGSGAVNIRATQDGDKNHNAAATVSKTLVVYGGGDDPSNPQIFLNVDEPGTLSSMIAENRKYQIKNLRLTGNLNGTDINFIREMAGSDSYGNSTPGVLESLDISGCTIVSGGRSYYRSNRTSENVVGNYMFYNCKVLTTLRIPDNTISIGDFALADCVRLSVILMPNCVKSYGEQSFSNDISLLRLPMSSELERIGDMAFSGCNGLTEIIIPSSVTSLGSGIVKDCQNIAQINVEAGNTNYASRDGILFNSDIDELIIFPVNHSGSEYVVPEGVNKISSYAFVSVKGLKSVNLPSSLSTIGQDAFIGCVNLNTLQVQAFTPPICQNDCFDNISKTRCELQVPIGCRSYYWVAPVWSEFNKIVETDFSGIEDVYYDNLQVGIINGRISVSGCPDNITVRIYQINGTLIYQEQANKGEIEFEPASHGMYIVMIGNKAFKLMVK